MTDLIPIDPEEFQTMEPGTVITEAQGPDSVQYTFIAYRDFDCEMGRGIYALCLASESDVPRFYSVHNWYCKPQPKPVIEYEATAIRSWPGGMHTIYSYGYPLCYKLEIHPDVKIDVHKKKCRVQVWEVPNES